MWPQAYERTVLKELSYSITSSTPFDMISELAIASPQLELLTNHCSADWELIEESFGMILERTVQRE